MFGNDIIDTRYFPLIGVSFLTFMAVYEKIGPYYSVRWLSSYKHMTTKEKLQWDNKICSTLHSVSVSLLVILCYLVEEEEFFKFRIRSDSAVVKINICVVIGYMFADTSHMVRNRKYIGNATFIVHHMVSIWPLWYAMAFRLFSWHANFRMMAEISTLFINVRWFLDEPFKFPKTSNAYAASGIALTVSFILARIVTIPFYYYPVYKDCTGSKYGCTTLEILFLIIPSAVLDALSLWWFRRVVVGFKKVIYEGWFKNVILEQYKNGTKADY